MGQTRFQIELEQEEDGRWIAEVPDLPGVLTYGATREEAMARFKPWPFASWQIASNTVKPSPSNC